MLKTPQSSRLHIALLGRRNVGKSSLVNSLTKQEISLVSHIPGTTTDPVYKSMEILPLGPVVLIDTAGIDDIGTLGEMRIKKTRQIFNKIDIVLLVIDSTLGISQYDEEIIKICQKKSLPLLVLMNKIDLISKGEKQHLLNQYQNKFTYPLVWVSTKNNEGLTILKEKLQEIAPKDFLPPSILGDLIPPKSLVLLVTPIDSSAPKGRLILPQVQTIRDILDNNCFTMVCKENEIKDTLAHLKQPPQLVITDSQVFKLVSQLIPSEIPLTSFSILMARYKGDLISLSKGAKKVDKLKPGDKILIAEACTHHQQPDDIGKVKIPRLLEKKIGGKLNFEFVNGINFPESLKQYELVIHCAGCMLNRKEMLHRIQSVQGDNIPIVNYGILIAHIHNILPRALKPFGINFSEL